MSTVKVRASESGGRFRLGVSESGRTCPVRMETCIAPAGETYDGPYGVTPGAEAQTLQTAGLKMLGDVTIGAIPAGWGRITWNGGFLTVS